MSKSDNGLLFAAGDFHVNSSVALIAPRVMLDMGREAGASKGQRWLWSCWQKTLDDVEKRKRQLKMPLFTVMGGDILDMDIHSRGFELITQNPADALEMANETLSRLVDMTDHLFVMRGTVAHVGKSACYEETFAKDKTNARHDPDTDNASWYMLNLAVGGVVFNAAHHGRIGGREWTLSNPLGVLAAEIMLLSSPFPDVALRFHMHRWADTGITYPVRVIAMPGWSLATEYSHRGGKIKNGEVGAGLFVCENGKYEFIKYDYKPARQTVWRLDEQKVPRK